MLIISFCFTYRVKEANEENKEVVDVDGSYLYRKFKLLTDAGEHVAHPACPSPPVTGWVAITDENRETIALSLPPVTPGKLVTTIYH